MSFSLTTAQYRNRTKTVTRRLGWANLKKGEQFMGIVKGMGLKKGDKIERIHPSTCVNNHDEPLNFLLDSEVYTAEEAAEDVVKEGFPDLSPAEFVEMFCKHNRCAPDQVINRIEFAHVP